MSKLRLIGNALRPRVSPPNPIPRVPLRSLSTEGEPQDPSTDPFLQTPDKALQGTKVPKIEVNIQEKLLRQCILSYQSTIGAKLQQKPFLMTVAHIRERIVCDHGLVFGRITGIGRNTLKTDLIHFFEGCNLSTSDVKVEYNRAYNPVGVLFQFPSRSSYDMALRQTIRKGRLYKLDKIDRSQWDLQTSYDGKAVLLQGIPRNALLEDVERFLSGCNFDPSTFQMFIRPGFPDPMKVALVHFRSQIDAMNAFISKNRGFCLNNPITMRVLQ